MAALLTCPNETLVNIISYLSTRDLLSVSRASRHFHEISLPLLYKAPFLCASGDYRQPELPGFMRALLGTPELALYVQSLEVQLEAWPSPPPSPGDIQSVASVASLFAYDPRKQGVHLVRLLRMLPRLTYLDLLPPDEPDCGSAMTTFLASLNDSTMLRNLREFRSIWNIGFTVDILAAVMLLPSIRTIVVTVRERYDEEEPAGNRSVHEMAKAAAGTSTVTDLRLLDTDLSEKWLAPLLTIPRALARFQHQAYIPQTHFDLGLFGKVLGPLASSLKYLNIGFTEAYARVDLPDSNIGPLGSWHALETLECPILALLGRTPSDHVSLVAVLPRGLRCLRVTEDVFWSTRRTVELIVGLLETGEMVSLREICLIFNYRIPESVLADLRITCEEANVTFVTLKKG